MRGAADRSSASRHGHDHVAVWLASRRRPRRWITPPARTAAAPIPMPTRLVTSNATPPTPNRIRSTHLAGPSSHPPVQTANAATAAAAEAVATRMVTGPPSISSPLPCGASTKTNGTRKAGRLYFQVSHIVLTGLPPVIAEAANGESAVGGDTSLRTA